MRVSLIALTCAAFVLLACTSTPNDDPTSDADPSATAVTTATVADSATTDNDNDQPTATPAPAASRFIGNTGGSGVSVRDACAQNARAGGAWADATAVLVLEVGVDSCDGWSYVARDGSLSESWVRNIYLVTEPPLVVARPPTSGTKTPTSTPKPTSTSTTPAPTPQPTPVLTYPQLSISPNPLNFGEISPGLTSVRSVLLTNTSQAPVSITSVVFANGSKFSGPFEVSPSCDGQTIGPLVACRLVIRFTPTSGGTFQATMLISSSSATAPLEGLVVGDGFTGD